MNEEDVLLRSFIGEKYDKFINKKFFVPAFLFGGLYYIYRKIYGLGIILYLLTVLVTLVLPEIVNNIFLIWVIHILTSVAYGIGFGPIYTSFSNNKIKNIKKQNLENKEYLLKACKSKGGTSFLGVIVVIILYTICLNIIKIKFDNNNMNSISEYNSETEISDKTSEYSGVLSLKSDINLEETIKIQIPAIFSKGFLNNTYNYEYKYDTNGEGVFDECKVSFSIVEGYTSANKLINEMAKYYSAIDTLKNERINNIEWSTCINDSALGTVYYSAVTHNELVYLFTYSIGKNVRGNATEYIKYYNSILNSIEFIK